MSIINVGGLATGLDTNSIITQLVALERAPLNTLQTQRDGVAAHQQALQTFNSKVLAFLSAVDTVRDGSDVLAHSATSSNSSVLTATADSNAATGTTSITVLGLARNAIATSAASGLASANAKIATGNGTFVFRVGSGADQPVPVDATTTLQGLADAINGRGAGAAASVVNAGTVANPDFRLRIASSDTGLSSDLTIVADATTLGISVTQAAANASFNVTGFSDPLSREHNTFDDVIPGVTISLVAPGAPVTISVATDTQAVTDNVRRVVNAFNDIVTFVAGENQVTQDTAAADHSVQAGPLAFDGTVQGVLSSLHGVLSGAVPGLDGNLTLLAQVGISTSRDGTLAFDPGKLATALASDPNSVSALFGGTGAVGGVADRLHDYITGLTQTGGVIDVGTKGIADQIASIDDQLAAGQRHLDEFQANLQTTFTNLEVVVSNLQAQGAYITSLTNSLGGTTR
jgi:flagellar hook-associated protein 2